MEQVRENRRKERWGKVTKTLEQEVLKKIAKKSLFVKLVNTERNESLVEQSISKEFLDLSAVVRVVLKMDKEALRKSCKEYDINPQRNEIGDWGLSRYDLRRLHNFLYKEGRPDANGKDDDPWAWQSFWP